MVLLTFIPSQQSNYFITLSFLPNITTISDREISIYTEQRGFIIWFKWYMNKIFWKLYVLMWQLEALMQQFDATIWRFDGAEICELVGLYLLDKLSVLLYKHNVELYCGNNLAVSNNANGPKLEKIRKEIIPIFKVDKLSIIIETYMIETFFYMWLSTFTLTKNFPYHTPNNNALYINMQSNYPGNTQEEIKIIDKNISELSNSNEDFDNTKRIYKKL